MVEGEQIDVTGFTPSFDEGCYKLAVRDRHRRVLATRVPELGRRLFEKSDCAGLKEKKGTLLTYHNERENVHTGATIVQ